MPLHKGIRADGQNLYPAMSYTSYTYMTDADALAIKAYLFSLPAVHAPAAREQARLAVRQPRLMGIWNAFYNADDRASAPIPPRARNGTAAPIWPKRWAIAANATRRAILAFAMNNRRKFAGALTAGWRAYNISADKHRAGRLERQ